MKIQVAAAVALMLSATPAFADETAPPPPITVSGSVALVSDYRFRGVSQSDKEAAIQGGITIAHESGFYVGTWGSNLAGWGQFGGSNMELDLIGGYKRSIGSGAAIDVGVTWYMYPGGSDLTDFAEPYVKLSGTLGPVTALAGVAYAPKQRALGNFSNTPQSRGQSEDNLYLWGDASVGIPKTPATFKAHVGYSDGNPGLGPNGTSVAPTGSYVDYLVGVDVTFKPVTLGIAYTGTDITRAKSAYLLPNFSSTKDGSSIAAGQVVFSISAAF
ncbi:TorF family putative porin [Sphingomonas sp. MMS24-J45]|uniref:TorF family putative porin n=1 Tax=Sphingomonas sp. MMS24-J45 TaxID=3238806 RepID=UPI00384B58A3